MSSSTPSTVATAPYSEWLDPRFRRLLFFQMAFGYTYSALLLVPKFATVILYATPQQIGMLAACPVIASIVVAPLCGLWLDRGGYRHAMLVGAAVFAASTFPFGFLRHVGPLLYALRALQGAGSALIAGGAASLVTRLVPTHHHGRAFGTAGVASLMMNAAASTATERIADTLGWGVAYEIAGASSLVALGILLRQPYIEEAHAVGTKLSLRSAAAHRRAGNYAMLAAGAGFGMLITFTQPYALSLGAMHVATMFVGYTATAVVVRIGLGNVVDRLGRRRAAMLALTLYACTVLAASALRPELLFALGLAFGVAHGLAWPALCALAVESAPAGRVGSALTRAQAYFAGGTMLAVWAGGFLVSARGYAFAFAAVAVTVASGAVALKVVRRGVPVEG